MKKINSPHVVLPLSGSNPERPERRNSFTCRANSPLHHFASKVIINFYFVHGRKGHWYGTLYGCVCHRSVARAGLAEVPLAGHLLPSDTSPAGDKTSIGSAGWSVSPRSVRRSNRSKLPACSLLPGSLSTPVLDCAPL